MTVLASRHCFSVFFKLNLINFVQWFDRTLNLSIAAGYDLTPLIHFWGIQPEDPESLKENMLELELGPSISLQEFLLNYKTLIPVTDADFNEIYETFFPGKPEGDSPLYGAGWFNAWKIDGTSIMDGLHRLHCKKLLICASRKL